MKNFLKAIYKKRERLLEYLTDFFLGTKIKECISTEPDIQKVIRNCEFEKRLNKKELFLLSLIFVSD